MTTTILTETVEAPAEAPTVVTVEPTETETHLAEMLELVKAGHWLSSGFQRQGRFCALGLMAVVTDS